MTGAIMQVSGGSEASGRLPAVLVEALPQAVVERLEAHAHAARNTMADETVRAWAKAWGAFSRWAAGQGLAVLPATAASLAAYVDSLAESGRSPAGIRQAVWAVGKMHKAAGLEDLSKVEVVKLALQRAARAAGTRQRQAAPLVDDDVRLAIRAAGAEPSLSLQRDLAMMMVMRDLLARRSEAVALDVEHVTFAPAQDGSATVLIERSKTDQEAQGAVRWLSPRTVMHLQRWLKGAGITTGAIFRAVNKVGTVGERLTVRDVPRCLKRVAGLAGLDAKGVSRISGHSCRVGMAQDLAAEGAELPAIMQAGRWKSPEMPARYAERMIAGRGAVAKFYERRRD
jgi:site-specific recombinase XerD